MQEIFVALLMIAAIVFLCIAMPLYSIACAILVVAYVIGGVVRMLAVLAQKE
jgi:hypothetical protein